MKIAFVHNQCLPYRHFLFRDLAKNFDIDFYVFNQKADDIPADCKTILLKGYRIPKFSDYWVLPHLKSKLRKSKYDLIIGNDLGAYNTAVAFKFAFRYKIPFIPWIEEWDWITHPRRKLRIKFENSLLNYSSEIIVPGVQHKNYLMSREVPERKIVLIQNCLEEKPKNYPNSHALAQEISQIKKNHTIVCSIGRHVPFKGHDQLIRAQITLEKMMLETAPFLIIAGNGDLLSKNKRLANSLGIKKIKFIERFINNTEKNILYSLSDIFVLPSKRTRAFEAWGLVCNEALYFEKPMIISDAVGAAGEIVRHKHNGFIYNNYNYKELANYIKILCLDHTLRETFQKNSQFLYKNYLPEVMKEKFRNLLSKYEI